MRILLPTLAVATLLAGCSAPAPPPPRIASVAPAPAYVPPAPQPPTTDWRDAALTPGDWQYGADAGTSVARFGSGATTGRIALQCVRAARQMVVSVAGVAAGPVTVRTSSLTQALSLSAGEGGVSSVRLSGGDPLLDAIAFSRGRFMIEAAGHPPLVVPVYAEIGRVIEDCRG